MHVLITGGAGYIGSHMAKVFARAGLKPVVNDNMQRGPREAVRWGPLGEADFGDREALEEIFPPVSDRGRNSVRGFCLCR